MMDELLAGDSLTHSQLVKELRRHGLKSRKDKLTMSFAISNHYTQSHLRQGSTKADKRHLLSKSEPPMKRQKIDGD